MKPICAMSADILREVRVLLTDIDDTLTTDGQLSADAYGALERLHVAGVIVIAVTGRPAGWCDHIARMWPVDGVVGENGAFYFVYDRPFRTMRTHFWTSGATVTRNRARLDRLARRILDAVPGARLASDQAYRIADLAVDFCEDVPRLGEEEIDRIVALFREEGAQARVSSIHVNGWFGDYDKLKMTSIMLSREFGVEASHWSKQIVFVGDSPNDEPMFAAFPLSVGVANINDLAHRLAHLPAYLTANRSGAGFVELCERLLAARAEGPSQTPAGLMVR